MKKQRTVFTSLFDKTRRVWFVYRVAAGDFIPISGPFKKREECLSAELALRRAC